MMICAFVISLTCLVIFQKDNMIVIALDAAELCRVAFNISVSLILTSTVPVITLTLCKLVFTELSDLP